MLERLKNVRRWIWWSMLAVLVLSGAALVKQLVKRNVIDIRLATAQPTGLYHEFGEALTPFLESESGSSVEVVPTQGTPDNLKLLRDGDVQLAILQTGSVSMEGLVALAPLYKDVIFVVVREGGDVESIGDLVDGQVAMGQPKSGMKAAAEQLLRHYGILDRVVRHDVHFTELRTNPDLDGAVIATGFVNEDLQSLLETGEFRILEIKDADAFCLLHPSYKPVTIPRGLYHEGPPVPAVATSTIGSTAIIAARQGVDDSLVKATVTALYESGFDTLRREVVPTLMTRDDAATWEVTPLHAVTRDYFNPYAGIGLIANLMESLAATKELLFALAAAAYLVWDRWRRMKERDRTAALRKMKERLDQLLEETARIEKAQMDTVNPTELKSYMDEVTCIKLQALDELTHESLRGDPMFLIFLIQCGNVIQKIQSKISIEAIVHQ